MNLDLQILVRTNPKSESITVWDYTGVGDGTNFPLGWQPEGGVFNTQNPKKSEVESIVITITYDDGTTATWTLDATERANYLDTTVGTTITAATFLGSDYDAFPDGIPIILVTMTGTLIGGVATDWEARKRTWQAFLTTVANNIRNWVIPIPVPVTNLDDVYNPTLANLMLDSIFYATYFGQIEIAQTIFDFLEALVTGGQNFTDYVNEHNI